MGIFVGRLKIYVNLTPAFIALKLFYLQFLGVGMVLRKMGMSVSPTCYLIKTGDEYEYHTDSTFKNSTFKVCGYTIKFLKYSLIYDLFYSLPPASSLKMKLWMDVKFQPSSPSMERTRWFKSRKERRNPKSFVNSAMLSWLPLVPTMALLQRDGTKLFHKHSSFNTN